MKSSWWTLKINDYPNYTPNEADLEHIAKMIIKGFHSGELIQEDDDNDEDEKQKRNKRRKK